jgi:hypothetical protein
MQIGGSARVIRGLIDHSAHLSDKGQEDRPPENGGRLAFAERRWPSSIQAGMAPASGPGHAAQPRRGPGQRLVRFALAGALEDAGHLGQQVGPAPGQRAQFGQRGRFFLVGERASPGAVARFAGDLGDEQTVGISPGTILVH